MAECAPDRFRFPRRLRVCRRTEFVRVLQAGLRGNDGPLTGWVLQTERPYARIGLIVGRKHGDAVRRNRLKRLMREAFRLSQHELPGNIDLILTPRVGALLTLRGCAGSLVRLAKRLERQIRE